MVSEQGVVSLDDKWSILQHVAKIFMYCLKFTVLRTIVPLSSTACSTIEGTWCLKCRSAMGNHVSVCFGTYFNIKVYGK